MKIVSWNINGARAIVKKSGWVDVQDLMPDVLCLQETKCGGHPLPAAMEAWPLVFRADAERRGYSGVATLTSDDEARAPTHPDGRLDTAGLRLEREGRCMITHHEVFYDEFALLNVYFPNGDRSRERLKYKYRYYTDICLFVEDSDLPVVICGDFNTAHHPIDLYDPYNHEKASGFLDMERAFIDTLEDMGLVDVWRVANPYEERFTWWDYRTRARQRDEGWRIDYFLVDQRLMGLITDVEIHSDIMGSDHCPVSVTFI